MEKTIAMRLHGTTGHPPHDDCARVVLVEPLNQIVGRHRERIHEQEDHCGLLFLSGELRQARVEATISGLFVEHFHEYQTIWHGERGRVFFYQCEMPYDPASQPEWSHDGINGWAGYKVADEVTTHEAWGLGVYAVFHSFAAVADYAIEVPDTPGVQMHHMVIMSLGGSNGTIGSVINGVGGPAHSGDPGPHMVDHYPVP